MCCFCFSLRNFLYADRTTSFSESLASCSSTSTSTSVNARCRRHTHVVAAAATAAVAAALDNGVAVLPDRSISSFITIVVVVVYENNQPQKKRSKYQYILLYQSKLLDRIVLFGLGFDGHHFTFCTELVVVGTLLSVLNYVELTTGVWSGGIMDILSILCLYCSI